MNVLRPADYAYEKVMLDTAPNQEVQLETEP